jgi:hypothetical protein
MTRAMLLALALSGCIEVERKGYILRSMSVDAAPRSIGMTWTFDNYTLPEQGGTCIGIEVCTDGAIE